MYSFFARTILRAHSYTAVEGSWDVQSVNVTELIRARQCSTAAVFSVESTVRTVVRHDTEDEGQFCATTPSQCVSAGNRYRLSQTPADVVPRESCRRSSGRATVQSTRHRRPGVQRYEPGLVTSVVDRAASTRQPTVTSTTATCSGGVIVAPLLCCSARCFGDIYVLCTASSVLSLF